MSLKATLMLAAMIPVAIVFLTVFILYDLEKKYAWRKRNHVGSGNAKRDFPFW